MNCRAKWKAQFAFKANNPNERLPLKDDKTKNYDKDLFKTPYTDNDCGQQKWGGWNLEGQKEFLKIRKEIRQAKKAKIQVQEGEETEEVNKFEQVEKDYMKMLIEADDIAQVHAQRPPPAARAPNERDTFDPNAYSDSEDDDDDDDQGKGGGKAKDGKAKEDKDDGEGKDGNDDDDDDDEGDGKKKGAGKRTSSRSKGGSAAKKSKTK